MVVQEEGLQGVTMETARLEKGLWFAMVRLVVGLIVRFVLMGFVMLARMRLIVLRIVLGQQSGVVMELVTARSLRPIVPLIVDWLQVVAEI